MIKGLLRGPYLFSALLAAGIVLALAAIGLETDWGRAGHSVPVVKRMAPARVADAGLLPAFSLAPIDKVTSESGERPLWVPTRRAAPVLIQASEMRKGQFLLQGTSITKDFGDIAMLKEVATNRTHVVRKGEQLNGITVERVEPGRVLLKQGDDSEDLGIRTQGSPKGAPLAQVPSGPIFPQPAPQSAPPASATAVPKPPATVAVPEANPPPAVSQATRTSVPQPAVAPPTPLTPEEILARRRAARSQQAQ